MTFYEKSILSNGLTVVTEHVPNVRSVAIGFWVGVGSRHESLMEGGMSHFMEHMLFKGTKTRSAKDISETFETLGAELNAFTSKEFTCFYSRLIDEHLDIGIEVLADMMQNPKFDKSHMDSEKQVVLEEIAMYEDTPDEQIHDIFTATLWPEHPLGKSVLGSNESVSGFDPKKAKTFFDEYYYPENIVVAAAGNVKHQDVLDLLNKFYVKDADGEMDMKDIAAKTSSSVKIINKKTEQVHICLGTAALDARHPDRFAMSVMENVIGGGMSSRLFQKVREEKGLAYAVFSYHSLFQETGNLAVYAGTRVNNMNEVLKIIFDELYSIADKGITKAELNRSREHIKGQLALGLESTRNRMTRLGKSELIHGEILSVDELVEKVSAVDLEGIKRLAASIFDPEKMVLTVIGPITDDDLDKDMIDKEIKEA